MKRTFRAALNFHKCLACLKGWLDEKLCEWWVSYATVMLERYPKPKNWHQVWFSDEVHFGYGPEGQLQIIRKPSTQYHHDCVQHQDPHAEKDLKRFHCWAAVGWNFKSDIIFYTISTNTNGKMSMREYIDQILEPVVKSWILQGDDFVLEEDNDSGHSTGKKSIACSWKKTNNLESYFNYASSPDLAPIENCWSPPKQYIRKFPHWDEARTTELIKEGWASFEQIFINERVNSMPDRLRAVIESGGVMTGYWTCTWVAAVNSFDFATMRSVGGNSPNYSAARV